MYKGEPLSETMFMAAMAVVLPWKIVEDFQSFVKNTKLWPPFFLNLYLARKWVKELTMVLFESLIQGLHILFHNIFGQTIYWSTAKPWTSPKKTFK